MSAKQGTDPISQNDLKEYHNNHVAPFLGQGGGSVDVVEELSDIDEMSTFDGEAAGAKAVKALHTAFSNALTALKNTAIAQAVGATAQDTFTSLITKLGNIVNRGGVSQTLNTTTTSYTVPEGYHDGTGTVSINIQEITVTGSRTAQTVTPDSGKVLSKVVVNKYPDASGVYTVPGTGNQDMGTTNNYRYVNADNVYNSGVSAGGGATRTEVSTFVRNRVAAYNSGVSGWGNINSQADANNYVDIAYSQGVTNADARANPSSVNYRTGYNNGYSAGRGSINMAVQLLSSTNGNQSFNVAVGDLIIETNALTSYAISGLQYLADTNSPNNQTVIWRATATTVTLYGNGSRIWRVYRY